MEEKEILEEGRRVLTEEARALERLAESLGDSFVKAVKIISQTKGRVVLTGVGKSGLICKKIAATLSSTGTPAFFFHPTDAAHGDLGMLRGEDTVIAVSNSGESKELLSVIPIIKSFGIPVIGITSNPNSSLARLSDLVINLLVEKEACPLNLAPTTSTTATLALGDAIAVALMKLKGFKPEDFAKIVNALMLTRKEIRVFNTICNATFENQDAAAELAKDADVMIVIGGKHSSNTKQLHSICKRDCDASYLIENEKELEVSWFEDKELCGISAGASTPDWIVQNVIDKIQEIKKVDSIS
jgi:KpsF/GutQ family protein